MKSEEDEGSSIKESVQASVVKPSFWEQYKSYIFIGLMALFFVLAYTQKFTGTDSGILFTGLFVFSVIGFLLVTLKSNPSVIQNDEFAKDPNFYYQYVKEYYSAPTSPRIHMSLTWTGRYMYYPMVQPSLIFLELYDKIAQSPMIGIVRIMRNAQQLRALFKSTWRDFIHNFFFRMKLGGILPSKSEQINVIGKDGKPVSLPGDYIDILQERGII